MDSSHQGDIARASIHGILVGIATNNGTLLEHLFMELLEHLFMELLEYLFMELLEYLFMDY